MENVFDKNFEKNVNDIINQNHDDMIKKLRELIAIRSVVEDAAGDKPFGEGVHEAFMYMKGLAEHEGFEFKNVSNYGGHIEFAGENADDDTEIFGILGHIDVVPEGADWDYEPYAATVEGDLLYGRGAIDDKGPTIAAFYAMKALKDAGFKPNKKIRLILGQGKKPVIKLWFSKSGSEDTENWYATHFVDTKIIEKMREEKQVNNSDDKQ